MDSHAGLLIVDLRFGDVIDDAARYFKYAYDRVGFAVGLLE
ncbi:putative ATP citrate synthase [Helianthus annuus]|uniref:ATP citrate synthase n=1 Tax=Helianthus annuus TaxID=4232 RepID=A0A9K3NSR6_HELAN|nr:putative ATP citrate synthase [Helianthus annuus]KAJ0598484.1 putative ATP citrate synthase [Helianthus annuus]KAJ0759084.1 putative ATP citrate synthase [Helianthus annuus]